jgi:hypothetical protein
MTNPYLERLRGRIQEKQDPSQPSKPSKPSYEGFEGDQGCHFSENERPANAVVAGDRMRFESAKNATTAYLQNLQNPRSPDGVAGCRVTIIEIPAEGLRYRRTFAHLQVRPPAYVPEDRWQQAIADGRAFLREWGSQAEALDWDSRSLFGLHAVPEKPHPSYRRLSRYDATGLCWLLQGREVVALTADSASMRNPKTGVVTVYRRHLKPGLGPLGDSLEDLK